MAFAESLVEDYDILDLLDGQATRDEEPDRACPVTMAVVAVGGVFLRARNRASPWGGDIVVLSVPDEMVLARRCARRVSAAPLPAAHDSTGKPIGPHETGAESSSRLRCTVTSAIAVPP